VEIPLGHNFVLLESGGRGDPEGEVSGAREIRQRAGKLGVLMLGMGAVGSLTHLGLDYYE